MYTWYVIPTPCKKNELSPPPYSTVGAKTYLLIVNSVLGLFRFDGSCDAPSRRAWGLYCVYNCYNNYFSYETAK